MMKEFLFRDNLDELKTKVPYVSFYKYGEWLFYKPALADDYNKIYGAKGPPKPSQKYVNCPHCGFLKRQGGIGAHSRSLQCLAERARLQALLDGYVTGPIQYNNLTSPFSRRYPTRAVTSKGVQGSLQLQVFFEFWFAKLWIEHLDYSTITAVNPITGIPNQGTITTNRVSLYRNKVEQRPKEPLLPCFKELAAAKRRKSKSGIQQAINNIILTTELTKDG